MKSDRLAKRLAGGPQFLELGEGQCRTEKRKDCRIEEFVNDLKETERKPPNNAVEDAFRRE